MVFKKILIGVDNSENFDKVLQIGVSMAKANEASVALVNVLDPTVTSVSLESGVLADSVVQLELDNGKAMLEKIATAIPGKVETFLPWGAPGEEIVNIAEEWGADLVLVGTEKHSTIERLFIGSVASHVVTHAKCAVLVIPIK